MEDLLERVRCMPCGHRLLNAVAGEGGVHLVGGAVRDLVLDREPAELDVVVEGDIGPLAARLGDTAAAHERFGTATVRSGDCRWDLAAARAESYARPGALPDVRPASIVEDLRRRDVTINALALDLATGVLLMDEHARDDLDAGLLRVLHDESFRDDPTRLWRLARYAARLDFALEERTARLATEAVAGGALDTVSGARIGNELRLALREPYPVAALRAAVDLGIAPWLAPDEARTLAALSLLPAGEGRPDLLVLGTSLVPGGDDRDALLAELDFTAAEWTVLRACGRAQELTSAAAAATRCSEIAGAFRGVPVEAVALAGAWGAQDTARRWLDVLRAVRLEINGDDLIAAGIAQGPEVGRRLRETLARRLDGQLPAGREAELAAALELE